MFQAALHFITSGDFNITLYCIQVINCFMETVTSLPFDLHSLINSYRQIVMLSPKHELYVSESIVMIITYIDFTHYLHPLLDLLYQILDSHPTEQTVKYSITSLNLLMGCNDRYYDDILYRGLDDPIKKLVGREDLNHTNSEFIEPLLSFISKVVFLIDGPKSDILIKKIGYFDALYALFHNHNIEKARSLVLDIFIQVIEKELDTIYFKICYRLIEYLVEKNFILELFSIFEDSNFDIKVNIIRFFKVIMSSKLHKMYQKMVEEDHLNYFDVCGSFCVSCMDPEIFKWFLETMINIWEVAEQLDEVGIISEKSEELNEQIAEFVHNNKEEELMKLAEMYFNQISKDEEEEAE